MTRHRWIRYHVTMREAILYAGELVRRERLNEFHRQKLYEVINGSLGGSFTADKSLLEESLQRSSGPPKGRQQLANWIRLADVMGADVPASVRDLANA